MSSSQWTQLSSKFLNLRIRRICYILLGALYQDFQGYLQMNVLSDIKTSQELRMLSNVTLDCQVAKIVMNSGPQLSEL